MSIARYVIATVVACALSVAATPTCWRRPRSEGRQRATVAGDPDVLGAERLFSAWVEGQIAYRGFPGSPSAS